MVKKITNYQLPITKKGSIAIYLVGLTLAIAFGAILMVQPKVLAQTHQIQTIKTEEPTPVVPTEPPKSDSPSPAPESKKVAEAAGLAKQKSDSPSPASAVSAASSPVAPVVIVAPIEKVKVAIGGVGTYSVEIKSGDSAFDALKKAASENGFVIDYSVDPTYGVFLNGIAGVQNSYADSKYWTLYYNGAMAQVGASSQLVSNNDSIEWKYEVLSW